jgi:tyrosyl-tRNA synthetase
MNAETRLEIIKRSPTEEIITEKELLDKLKVNEKIKHYIGFEISGLLHLGTLISAEKVNDLIEAGIDCTIYLADWHSYLNKKLGGNWENILKASKYWEKAFNFYCPGAKIILGSDLYYNNNEYWKDIVKFSSQVNLTRIARCLTILGRTTKESLSFAQYFYPVMQAVDIKYLGPDLAHGGMDQRKVHVLARDIYPKLGWKKPIALHHHLLMGLNQPIMNEKMSNIEVKIAFKMSKSNPKSAIFIHDSYETIKKKILSAWCPERIVENNPILDICKYLIFRKYKSFLLERSSKFGGNIEFENYAMLEKSYIKGEIHPLDLKMNVARYLDKIIDPIRNYFEHGENKKLYDWINKSE